MSLLSMPIDELKAYKGVSPCPDDIDRFWDDSLKELERVDPCVEFTPAYIELPNAECFDLFFTGIGGARIHAKFARPRSDKGSFPAAVGFHGYTLNSGDWLEKVAFAASGCIMAYMDCRGQGGLSEDSGSVKGNTLNGHIIRGLAEKDPKKLYYRNVFLDAVKLVQIIMGLPYVDENRVGCFGGSQGGALSIVCAALEPRLKWAAPMFPFLSDYKRACHSNPSWRPYSELNEYFRHSDPRRVTEDEVLELLSYIDIQNLAHRVHAEITMYTALMDTEVDPVTQFAAFNKIEDERKRYILYPDYGHEMLPGYMDDVLRYTLEG